MPKCFPICSLLMKAGPWRGGTEARRSLGARQVSNQFTTNMITSISLNFNQLKITSLVNSALEHTHFGQCIRKSHFRPPPPVAFHGRLQCGISPAVTLRCGPTALPHVDSQTNGQPDKIGR